MNDLPLDTLRQTGFFGQVDNELTCSFTHSLTQSPLDALSPVHLLHSLTHLPSHSPIAEET